MTLPLRARRASGGNTLYAVVVCRLKELTPGIMCMAGE